MKPASFREVRTYPRAAVTRELVEEAARRLRWKIVESNERSLRIRVPFNIWSMGEYIDVALDCVDESSLVGITSTCIYKTQWADWGKNERNTGRFFLEVDNVLGGRSASKRCPLCSRCGYLLAGLSAHICPECGTAPSQAQRPASQDVATLRNVATFGILITGIEIAICFLLGLVDVGRTIPCIPRGLDGAVLLLKVNFFSLLAILVLHRLVRHFMQRRTRVSDLRNQPA